MLVATQVDQSTRCTVENSTHKHSHIHTYSTHQNAADGEGEWTCMNGRGEWVGVHKDFITGNMCVCVCTKRIGDKTSEVYT